MESVYSVFEGFGNARIALAKLMKAGVKPQEVNVIVQEDAVKRSATQADSEGAQSEKHPPYSREELGFLDHFLADRRPVRFSDQGRMYFAGDRIEEIAQIITTEPQGARTINAILNKAEVPHDLVEYYADQIEHGDVFIWTQSKEVSSKDIRKIMREHKGAEMTTVGD
ncbi:MAG: hypothetical protein ACOC4C_01215 [Fibrobacterota bacterium]